MGYLFVYLLVHPEHLFPPQDLDHLGNPTQRKVIFTYLHVVTLILLTCAWNYFNKVLGTYTENKKLVALSRSQSPRI